MYTVRKVRFFQLFSLHKVSVILIKCGRDMAQKYGLQHWNNSYIKNAAVVALCALKNKIYLVYDESKRPIATFQTKKIGDSLRFQKLGTNPDHAGKGVGSFCMQTIENMAKDLGCCRVCLEVYDKSEHAKAFYEHRGYVVCGKAETLKYTELQMEKGL